MAVILGTDDADTLVGTDDGEGAIRRIVAGALAPNDTNPPLQLSVSPDGTKILFGSDADNLVPGDTNKLPDIFVADLTTGAVTRVDTTASGEQATGASTLYDPRLGDPVFSPDGSKVAFYSAATNLVPGDTNRVTDVFIKDLASGAITRVSTDSSGDEVFRPNTRHLGTPSSVAPVFSPDGTKLLFLSDAVGLVPGNDPVPLLDFAAYSKDLVTGETTRIDIRRADGQLAGIEHPVFSPDGTKLLFSSIYEILPGVANGDIQLYVKDLTSGVTSLVSATPSGAPALGFSFFGEFSPDGTKILFDSDAADFVPGFPKTGAHSLFLKDLTSGSITPLVVDASGKPVPTYAFDLHRSFSADGTKIVFSSPAPLVDGDTNGKIDVFVKDLVTGSITLASADAAGSEGNGNSYEAAFAPDGLHVAFASVSSNLVPGDVNGRVDIFVKQADGGPDLIDGKGGDDVISGRGGADRLHGGDGADQISGGLGTDLLDGDRGGDRLAGDDGNDVLRGGGGDDWVSGGAGNDFLGGAEGDDRLDGGIGDDRLRGGAGDDILTGGAGRDLFIVNPGFGTERITDFEGGPHQGDRIDLRAIPGLDSYAELQAMMKESDGAVVIVLSTGGTPGPTIIIEHATIAGLAANDFIL